MGAVREPGNRAPSTVPARPGPRNPSRRVLSAPPCGGGSTRGGHPRVAGRGDPSCPGAAPGRGVPSAAGRAGVAAHTGEATAHSKLWRAQPDRRDASACAGTRRPLTLGRDTPRGTPQQRPAGRSRRAGRRTPGTPQRDRVPAPPTRPPQRVRVRRDATAPHARARRLARGVPAAAGRAVPPGRTTHARDTTARSRPGAADPTTAAPPRAQGRHDPSRSEATPRAGRPGSGRAGGPTGQDDARRGRHSAFASRRRRVRPPRRTSCPPPGRGRGGNRV